MPRLHSYDESVVNFYNVDAKALKVKSKKAETFPDLIQQLKKATKKCKYPELYLVRGLLAWIAQNQASTRSETGLNTPLFYVRQLVKGKLPTTSVFKTFFGYAGIECTEINGRAKAIRYRAGDNDSDYLNKRSWIAFKADGKWHLMHPKWSIHAYRGYQHGGEIEIEKDGKNNVKVREEKLGKSHNMMNDFWFCTAPEIFVTRCLPDDPKWQSPADGKVFITAVDQYISAPDLRQGFYNMKLSLMSEQSCILHSSKGKCFISILAEKDMINRLDFSYELVVENSSDIKLDAKGMQQLVLPQIDVNNRIFKFEVRLPVVGVYWLRLFVGFIKEDEKLNCCGFKIICKKASKNCHKFPTCKGLDVYGYGPKAVDAGLVCSSETNAKIKVKPSKKGKPKQALATFRTDEDSSRDMNYEADILFASDSVDGDQINTILPDATEVIHNKAEEELIVKGKIEKKGEYAVVIKAIDKNDTTQKEAKPVAGYLVTTESDEDDDKNNALLKKRQKEIRNLEKRQSKLEYIKKLKEEISDMTKEIKAERRKGFLVQY